MNDKTERIAEIFLDERNVIRRRPEVEHERRVAIFDLLENNCFSPIKTQDNNTTGPYNLYLGIEDNRLHFDIRSTNDIEIALEALPISSFRRIVKDYFMICESYNQAIKTLPPSQIEAIDMGRRGLHNEGAEILQERLVGKIQLDKDTARRLFTLICVLHIKA